MERQEPVRVLSRRGNARYGAGWLAGALPVMIAIIVVFTQTAAAQGCAACYESAAASGAQGRTALRHGILILLIPTLSLIGLIVGLVYKRRDTPRN